MPKIPFFLTFDHGLAAFGVVAALGSATFAGLMITSDNSHPKFGGAEHLMLFAQPSHGLPARAEVMAKAEENPGVDYSPTATIPRASARPLPADKSRQPIVLRPPAIRGYVVRDANDGTAIVEDPLGALYQIELGSVLPGGVRILSIERRLGKWVVVTSAGLIGDRGS